MILFEPPFWNLWRIQNIIRVMDAPGVRREFSACVPWRILAMLIREGVLTDSEYILKLSATKTKIPSYNALR